MRMIMSLSWLLICFSSYAYADVKHKSDTGFIVAGEVRLPKKAESAWKQLLSINQWWEPSHSFSGNAANLYLDIHNEKCFCERWQGSWVRHLAVIAVQEQKILMLEGGLGPLQSEGVHGVLTITLEDQMMSSVLKWSYKVHGFTEKGLSTWAAPVDQVLTKQFDNLRLSLK